MLHPFESWFRRVASGPAAFFMATTMVACVFGFYCRKQVIGDGLDSRWWYTAAETKEFFQHIGPSGCKLYAVTQVSLDLVFPLAYAAFFGWILIHLYRTAGVVLLVPLLMLTADWLENAGTAFLAATFDSEHPREASVLTGIAAAATFSKWLLWYGPLPAVLLIGVLLRLGHWLGLWGAANSLGQGGQLKRR